MTLQPVILAGGSGYRLWPLSDKVRPKQFIKYFDNLSSFQKTVIRNRHLGIPLIIGHISHKEILKSQLDEIGIKAQIIFEPEQKNTAICALIGAYYAKEQGFNSIALLPCDHHIISQTKYRNTLNKAINAIMTHPFVTIGIKPNIFNHNFGYVRADFKINKDLYHISKFIEKPESEFVDQYSYFWNSGIYLFDIDYFFKVSKKLMPITNGILSHMPPSLFYKKDELLIEERLYKHLPAISFDNAISVHLKKMVMIKANFIWNDLGNWEAIWGLETQDAEHNKIIGKVITHNVKNSYINSDAKETVAIDLEDTIVVFKNGKLVISHKDGIKRIKDILINFENTG